MRKDTDDDVEGKIIEPIEMTDDDRAFLKGIERGKEELLRVIGVPVKGEE